MQSERYHAVCSVLIQELDRTASLVEQSSIQIHYYSPQRVAKAGNCSEKKFLGILKNILTRKLFHIYEDVPMISFSCCLDLNLGDLQD
jgi:hypothetical protein